MSSNKLCYKEAMRIFAAYSDMSVGIRDPDRHLEPRSEMRLIPLETRHQLSIIVPKIQTDTSTCPRFAYSKI